MSPVPQYRSKILTGFLRRFGTLRARTQTWIRHAKVIGQWTVEAALYPLYRWTQFQANVGKQLGQSWNRVLGVLSASVEQNAGETNDYIEEVLTSVQLISPTQAQLVKPRVQKPSSLTVSSGRSPLHWIKRGISALRRVGHGLGLRSKPSTYLGATDRSLQVKSPGVNIQGIASLLHNRKLVLITPEQEILDILTPWQQIRLRQKIAWAIYHFSVRFRLCQARHKLAAGLRSLVSRAPALLLGSSTPVGLQQRWMPALPQLMGGVKRWMVRSVIGAIAAFPIVAIPAIASETSPQPKAPEKIEAQWIDPSRLKSQIAWDEVQGMSFQQTQSRGWLATAPSPARTQTSLDPSFYTADNGIEIPVTAEFLGYEPHLLEQVLGWLDRLLIVLEAAIALIWRWIGLIVVVGLAVVQKVRQAILG